MNPLIQSKQTPSLFLVAFACFALSPLIYAQCPQTCNGATGNTAIGNSALESNTTGSDNTATGNGALETNTTGASNTANGEGALASNTTANDNTAVGWHALFLNQTASASGNTAIGDGALYNNFSGSDNTATGNGALYNNTTASGNTATGWNVLPFNTTGHHNVANGYEALYRNTTGGYNTANGVYALFSNIAGNGNTAIGIDALYNTTGGSNIALGVSAGINLTTGSHNIDIGSPGVAGESNTTRIGNIYSSVASGRAVYVNSDNKIGTLVSSRRFKEDIEPMEKASEAILALRPVSFRYKKDIDANGTKQFGLVAEEVEKVNPELVTRDEKGNPETVRYDAVNAMLLNEFLKEHRKTEKLEATVALQQQQIEALTAGLQKVSAQLELNKAAPRTALND